MSAVPEDGGSVAGSYLTGAENRWWKKFPFHVFPLPSSAGDGRRRAPPRRRRRPGRAPRHPPPEDAPLPPRLGLGTAACVWRNGSGRRGHVARFAAAARGGGDEAGELSEDEAQREWEAELNRRLKEAEEMEELERTAEQLQSQAAAEATEESEEEKRERVRRELQKVGPTQLHSYS